MTFWISKALVNYDPDPNPNLGRIKFYFCIHDIRCLLLYRSSNRGQIRISTEFFHALAFGLPDSPSLGLIRRILHQHSWLRHDEYTRHPLILRLTLSERGVYILRECHTWKAFITMSVQWKGTGSPLDCLNWLHFLYRHLTSNSSRKVPMHIHNSPGKQGGIAVPKKGFAKLQLQSSFSVDL